MTYVKIPAALMMLAVSAVADAAQQSASAEMGVSAVVIASVSVEETTASSGANSLSLTTDVTPALTADEGVDVSYDGSSWVAVAIATAADEPLYVTLTY